MTTTIGEFIFGFIISNTLKVWLYIGEKSWILGRIGGRE